jgi:hypothetical protein
VIVFHQRRVVKTETMVGAAAHAHGVFFQRAKARSGLARIDDLHRKIFNRVHVTAGHRRRAGKALEKIQSRPLAHEQRPDRPLGLRHHGAARHRIAVLRQASDFDAGVQIRKNPFDQDQAGDHAVALGTKQALAPRLARNRAQSRDVARADVFFEGAPEELLDLRGDDDIHA